MAMVDDGDVPEILGGIMLFLQESFQVSLVWHSQGVSLYIIRAKHYPHWFLTVEADLIVTLRTASGGIIRHFDLQHPDCLTTIRHFVLECTRLHKSKGWYATSSVERCGD
jgi:hypothetical protein